MIRIIHLTDFHLNPRNLKDWHDFVEDALLKKLIMLNDECPIDFIAYTGDLLDKGGKDYKDANTAFTLFQKEVITPIINSINLPTKNFIMIPGNHDIVRSLDDEREELGSKAFFQKTENIAKYIQKSIRENSFNGMKRIEAYKKFEKSFYDDKDSSINLSIFGSSFKYNIAGKTIGVCALNSSWRCYSNDDTGQLLVGEDQLTFNAKFIKDCDIKIGLIHHPLDGLSVVERSTISNHIHKEFDLLLLGHTHETITTVATGFTGSLFINVAPSGLNDIRSDSRTFANGFTMIDFDKIAHTIDCVYWRYNHDKKDFVLNTDASVEDNGTSHYSIPDKETSKKTNLLITLISNIKEDHYSEMDEHLIGSRALVTNESIKDAFVMPPIDQGSASSEDDSSLNAFTISQIVQYKHNLMFFGNQESGKTILLYRLIREYIDEFEYLRKIPVYIDFEEIGNKEINTKIREYLRCGTQDVKELLKENQLVILLDNLQYSKEGNNRDQINRLHTFSKENQYVQFIATSDNDIIGILPTDYIELSKMGFINFFIRNLRSQEIKSLMKVWLPEEDDLRENERLEKMVSTFNSYSLPSTAMSVSLFLWSTENSERKPINNAVLMEIYIEIILEKLNKQNIYRGTFDFTNKIQLLAKIAHVMLLENEVGYSILYSQFVKSIESYLKDLVGFSHDPQVIIEYFIERKLFVKYNGNRIKFTYSCFFHFFIGKRMEYSQDFREYVLDETRYFEFPKEIDYYTGLVRSDKKTFELILKRFEAAFKPTDGILEKIPDIDNYFTPAKDTNKLEEIEPIVRNMAMEDIISQRPSEMALERYYNQRLSQIPDPSIIVKKDSRLTLDRLLVLMSNTLRNSEGVEDLQLKKRAYQAIIKYSLTFMILYKESLIDFIVKNKRLPASIPSHLSFEHTLTNVPLSVQLGMFKHLGTQKLSSIIVEKINADFKKSGVSNVESFLSVALYADIQGNDFEKYFHKFIKTLKNRMDDYIVCDYSFHKLIDYYYRRTRNGSPNEETYLDLLAELRIRAQKLPKRMKERLIKTLEDGKKQFNKSFS